MTERDSPRSFLERWSRKKIEGEREASESSPAPETPDASLPEIGGSPERHAKAEPIAPAEAAPKPEFDLASLPSLDSITAVTDIRAFLAPGVPKELARAALRRAWSADPAIRDFKGLAENDWDFTDPAAMPGFGTLPPGYDIKKILAQIFSDGERPADQQAASVEPPAPQAPGITEQIAVSETHDGVPPAAEGKAATSAPQTSESEQQVADSNFVHRNNIVALHNSIPDDGTDESKNRRPHGGALPQ
jgi:hypothetical protein